MLAKVLQINISPGGLPKRPVHEARISPMGVEGDLHNHPEIHGGADKALLLIAKEAVDDLKTRGYPLFYGAMGENLTTQGLDYKSWRAGQRYRIGYDVIIELTQPRGPCKALHVYGESLPADVYDKAVKARDPRSPKWGMSGFYASVVKGGLILPGAPIMLISQDV
ncbi:MAG: MOSC domain-containing protein [Acidobacteria bacterium]|nr:MOSC domain-containing protein [Acidobacteriota bacterium]